MSEKARSILFCLDYYWPHLGGGEVLFTGIAEGLAARGWRVKVLTQGMKGVSRHEFHNGVEIFRHWSRSRYTFAWASIPAMCRLAADVDLIHTEIFAAAIPAWIASRIRHKPLALTVHEVWIGKWAEISDGGSFSNWANDKIERLIYCFDYRNYIAVSHATARELMRIGVPKERIEVIHNGIDYDLWNPAKYDRVSERMKSGYANDEFIFMYSGRPGRTKGFSFLLKAFASIAGDYPNALLVARLSRAKAVRHEYEAALALTKELGIEERVRIIPPVPFEEIPPMTLCADAIVVPSLSEGFGFVAAEACAMGRPVIVSDNASLPEVVSGNLLQVPPRDVEALSAALKKALQGKWETIPERCFPVAATLEHHIDYYERLLK